MDKLERESLVKEFEEVERVLNPTLDDFLKQKAELDSSRKKYLEVKEKLRCLVERCRRNQLLQISKDPKAHVLPNASMEEDERKRKINKEQSSTQEKPEEDLPKVSKRKFGKEE